MKALLLAAGLGTRLRPITNHVPKCLVPIKQKPLLAYWLELLTHYGIKEIFINTHYLPKLVNDFIEHSPWRHQVTLLHEPNLLGTAGTVLSHRHLFDQESFLLAHADNLTRFNFDHFKLAHQNSGSHVDITMMTFMTDQPENCGIVELDKNNIVKKFHEKSKINYGNLANAAVYLMKPAVIDFLAGLNKNIIDMSTEVLPHYLGRMQSYLNSDYHRDIGTPESLAMAEAEY
jgi:mannose-1-phosphate guanylyltransferase